MARVVWLGWISRAMTQRWSFRENSTGLRPREEFATSPSSTQWLVINSSTISEIVLARKDEGAVNVFRYLLFLYKSRAGNPEPKNARAAVAVFADRGCQGS